MTLYLDSSALVKLVVDEDETAALRAFLRGITARRTTSALARTEVVGAVRRRGPDAVARARSLLGGLHDVAVSRGVLDAAADIAVQLGVRALDAVHLATAGELGPQLEMLITYDRRMAAGAEALGFEVVAPS